jgi:hypothetical protein
LLWLAPASNNPTAGWFPTKEFYDIAGPDTYATNPPYSGMFATTQSIVGTTVPIPLHENGTIPNPAQMFPSAAPWVLFNTWAGYQNGTQGTASQMNTLADVKAAYEDPHTITRDEVPNLK